MAHRLLRPAARTTISALFSHLSPSHFEIQAQSVVCNINSSMSQQTRGYVSQMRQSALEGNFLRLLRNEIQYELDHSPSLQPVLAFNSFTVDERPGRLYIVMNKNFGEDEAIEVEVAMVDGNASLRKQRVIFAGVDAPINFPMVVEIYKRRSGDVLVFECSTWPDSIEIKKVIMDKKDRMTDHQAYMGPLFADLDDDLQESLYTFLESRGINSELAVYLHKYMQSKRHTENIRWMRTVKSIIEKKV